MLKRDWLWKKEPGDRCELANENTYIMLTGKGHFPQTDDIYSNNTYIPTHVKELEIMEVTRILNIGESEFPGSDENEDDSVFGDANENKQCGMIGSGSADGTFGGQMPPANAQGGLLGVTQEGVVRRKLSARSSNMVVGD